MRKVTLYFVIGLTPILVILSFVTFLLTHNVEVALGFQVPAWLVFYRILCYLFPTPEGPHPILAFLRIFGKHP